MRPLTVFIFVALFVNGCVTRQAVTAEAHENDDILDAVFRHISHVEPVASEGSHYLNLSHKVYFVALSDSQDPSPRFIQRFRDYAVPVKPFSAALRKDSYVYDKVTGERGAAFYFRAISRLGRHKAEVEVDFAPGGGLSASGYLYRVVQREGKWRVTGEKLRWVS